MFIKKFTTKINSQSAKIAFFVLLLITQKSFSADIEAEVSVSPVGDFTAQFKNIDAQIIKSSDTIKTEKFMIPWSKLSTGMSLRDKHALKYFNADKYPNIEIISSLGKGGKGAAKIKMNGVEKIIKGTYEVTDKKLTANVTIQLSDFNVKDINFKGAGVQDEIKIKIVSDVD